MRYFTAITAVVALAWCGQGGNRLLGQETNQHGVSGWSANVIGAIHALPIKDRYAALINLAGIGCGAPTLSVVAQLPMLDGTSALPLWLADAGIKPAAAAAPVQDAKSHDDLYGAIEAAKSKFQPISAEQLTTAKSALDQRLNTLTTFLASDKTAEAGWKKFLLLDPLQEELAKGKDAKIETLRSAAARFASGEAGLEVDQFRQVRAALDRYLGLLAESQSPTGEADFKKRLDSLAETIHSYQRNESTADADAIGKLLGELSAGGQAQDLVDAVHARFNQPNLLVRASQGFIGAISQEQVSENNEIHDSILGTQVSGHAQVTGTRSAVLVDGEEHAAMDVLVNATANSQTVGLHSPVTIYAHGVTQLHGVKRVLVDADGYTDQPATSTACTQTFIDQLCICGGRIVQRIATKRVYQGKGEAECVASQHAKARLNEQMNSNATEGLAKQNASFQTKFRGPLLRRGAFPEMLRYASTPAAMTITAREGDAGHLAAPSAPPDLKSDWFLAVRVHESFINNLLAASLSGRTINKEEFDRAAIDLLGDIPKEVQAEPGEEEKDWTITFAKERPITVTFADSGFAITIRGRSYTSEPTNKKVGAMDVTARYKIKAGAKEAERIGELEIDPPNYVTGTQLTFEQTAGRRLLRKRFDRILKPTIPFEGVTFATEPWNKAGKLVSSQLTADRGWLTIGWNQAADSVTK